MTKLFKKTILIDLDGVLNTYKGNFNENYIPEPQQNVGDFLKKLNEKFVLIMFTVRNKKLAKQWLIKHKLNKYFNKITNIKEPAWLMIDDRCLKFEGNYEKLLNEINEFKPWYKNRLD